MATLSITTISLHGDTFNVADIKRVKPVIYEPAAETISYKVCFFAGLPVTVCESVSNLDNDEIMEAIAKMEEERQKIIEIRWPLMHRTVIGRES